MRYFTPPFSRRPIRRQPIIGKSWVGHEMPHPHTKSALNSLSARGVQYTVHLFCGGPAAMPPGGRGLAGLPDLFWSHERLAPFVSIEGLIVARHGKPGRVGHDKAG